MSEAALEKFLKGFRILSPEEIGNLEIKEVALYLRKERAFHEGRYISHRTIADFDGNKGVKVKRAEKGKYTSLVSYIEIFRNYYGLFDTKKYEKDKRYKEVSEVIKNKILKINSGAIKREGKELEEYLSRIDKFLLRYDEKGNLKPNYKPDDPEQFNIAMPKEISPKKASDLNGVLMPDTKLLVKMWIGKTEKQDIEIS